MKEISSCRQLSSYSRSDSPRFGGSPSHHTLLPLQSLPSLTPFELKTLFKASHKGFHNVFQQEPLKKTLSFIIPAGECSVSVLHKTVVYHAQRVLVAH